MKLKNYHNIFIPAICLLLLAGCSKDDGTDEKPVLPDAPEQSDPSEQPSDEQPSDEQLEEGDKVPLRLITKAEGGVVSTSVNVGLYMQHYVDGKMVELYSANNYLNNIQMNYSSGRWTTSTPIYWYDATSLSDIYAYAPYQDKVADCRKMNVSVPTDQSTTEQLAAADLLWGSNLALNPSTDNIAVILNHQLARVNVTIKPEADFEEGELKAEDLKLYVNNVRCEATMDLQTSELTLTGEPLSICAHNNGNLTFTAIVMPQTVSFVNLIRVEWKDVVYTLQHSTTFEAQRSYDFTVSVNRMEASGLNIGISGWDIDDKDYGGVVE